MAQAGGLFYQLDPSVVVLVEVYGLEFIRAQVAKPQPEQASVNADADEVLLVRRVLDHLQAAFHVATACLPMNQEIAGNCLSSQISSFGRSEVPLQGFRRVTRSVPSSFEMCSELEPGVLVSR